MVVCLERGADLHMAQLMPLSLTVSCFVVLCSSPSKLQPREALDNMPSDDDEHRLIARYTARLAADANNAVSLCLLLRSFSSRRLYVWSREFSR